jgi:lipopolysaccharide export system permease protein
MLWWMQRTVIPKANEIFSVFQLTYIDKNSGYKQSKLPDEKTLKYKRVDPTTYSGMRNYDTISKSGGPFFLHRVENNKVVYNLRADSYKWDTTNKQNKWLLSNVTERTINGNQERIAFIPTMTKDLNFTPADLNLDEYSKDKLATPELRELVKMEEIRGTEGINAMKVELYKRDATPFSVLILALIGGIVASRKVRGGSGMHLAIGLTAAATFVLLDRFSTIFSTNGNFPPLIAAWLPNAIFIIVAYYFYRRAPK